MQRSKLIVIVDVMSIVVGLGLMTVALSLYFSSSTNTGKDISQGLLVLLVVNFFWLGGSAISIWNSRKKTKSSLAKGFVVGFLVILVGLLLSHAIVPNSSTTRSSLDFALDLMLSEGFLWPPVVSLYSKIHRRKVEPLPQGRM